MHALRFVCAAGGLMLATGTASADFVAPTLWSRGDANTTYEQWEVFSSPAGPNAPDVAGAFNPNGTANAFDSSGQSFITSGGNIYSFAAPIDIDVVIPDYGLGASSVTTVILQVRTQGTAPDLSSFTLTYNDGSQDVVVTPIDSAVLYEQSLGGFGGSLVDRWFRFEAPFSATSLLLEFTASGSSMSADRIAVDTITTSASQGYVIEPNPVPEPASLALLAAGLGLMAGRGRRTRPTQAMRP